MTHVFINGALVPEAEALVSVNDRGFRFGDGVFETIPVYSGLPYLWKYHIERLEGGLHALRIALDIASVLQQSLAVIKANQTADGLLRIHVSRGVGSKGYLPLSTQPTIIIQTLERPEIPQDAVKLWISTYKKISPHALPTHFKLAQGINNTLARMEAAEQGCFDALQLDENGNVAETSSANIFWLKNNTLYTPSLASGALAGVTRRRIMEFSPYPVSEGLYSPDDLVAADAVIITNTAYGIMPVAGLSPDHGRWKSLNLANELNKLRNNDIAKDTIQLRDSLA